MNRDTNRDSDSTGAARIDVQRDEDLQQWARKLDSSQAQIKEAVQAVGDRASDVEEHLKGSRSTTNAERTREELKQDLKRAGDRPN